jgi:UDP-3-O-[3-hydroxymyristoyl] glucosamine N-acyltransferase
MFLAELAAHLSAQLIGDGQQRITGINTIRDASEGQLCFLLSDKYAGMLRECKASAVLLPEAKDGCPMAQLVVKDVERAMVIAMRLFAPKLEVFAGVHPSATIDPAAQVDPSASIGPHAVVAAGATVGASTVIGAGCIIGQNSVVGQRCRLDANVVVYHGCRIGNDCIIQSNTTIGSTGFGYYCIDGRHELIAHNGGVIIEDHVEIGANTCVDRAKFGNTVIGAGTKIDNLVQIAHNVEIGKHCLVAGQAGLGGSARLGNYVIMGGRSGVVDNVTIGDMTMFAACSLAINDIEAGQKMYGNPANDLQQGLKSAAVYQKLPEMARELKQLRRKVEQLEAAENDKK